LGGLKVDNARHVSFSKIPQFRDVIRNVVHQAQFEGIDQDNEPIFNPNVKKPTITFHGTVKLHGSNGGFCVSNNGKTWTQSRKRILSIEADNNGFWQFCNDRKDSFRDMIALVSHFYFNEGNPGIISIFGEYCGEGINRGCAIHQLPKMFIVFAVKTFEVAVDFAYPELAQNEFVELVNQVENECPVGKKFNVSGVGEGIVWTAEYAGTRHIFKTKGEKHSVSKVKKIADVDVDKINNVREFVEYAVTENRLNQAIIEIFEGEEPTIQKMGDFLRWIVNDIAAEEADTLGKNNLILKDVGRSISNKARPWFQELLNKNVGMNFG